MGIRFGRSRYRADVTTNALPQNRGMNDVAQRKIDATAAMAARKTMEAVRADGYPVYIWNRNYQANINCSCASNFSVSQMVQTELTETSQLETPSLETAKRKRFKIQGTGVDDRLGLDAIQRQDNPKENLDAIVDAGNSGYYAEEVVDVTSNLLDASMGGGFPNTGRAPCGICGGTSKLNGYVFISGDRHLLCAGVHSGDYSLEKVELDNTTRPYSFTASDTGAAIYWTLKLNRYWIGCIAARVMDNDRLARDWQLQVNLDGQWQKATPEIINTFRGAEFIPLKAVPLFDLTTGYSRCTHLEVVLNTVDIPYAQFPQLAKDADSDVILALLTVEFELEPTVNEIGRESLIENPIHHKVWKVSNILPKKTSKGFLFGVTGQARALQPNEPETALALDPAYKANIVTSFRGSEEVGGGVIEGAPYNEERGNIRSWSDKARRNFISKKTKQNPKRTSARYD